MKIESLSISKTPGIHARSFKASSSHCHVILVGGRHRKRLAGSCSDKSKGTAQWRNKARCCTEHQCIMCSTVQYLLHVNNVPPIIRGRVKPEDTCLVNHEIRQVVSNHRQAQPQRLKQHVQTLTCLWLKQPFRRLLFDRSHRRVF